jgi:hypothetical protein
MKMSKRQFIKVGIGGTAAVFLGPLLRPGSLLASPVVLPPGYLESLGHAHWMKLSFNHGRESRQTRRTVGAALRNIGAIKGKGRGWEFARLFDQAVQTAFDRFKAGSQKPASVFGLIQSLYEGFIFPQTGEEGGRVLYGTLLAVLRGRDGTAQGAAAYESYQAYRAAALEQKDVYKTAQDPKDIDAARRKRIATRVLWQQQLTALVQAYAQRKLVLRSDFSIQPDMLEGFEIYMAPLRVSAPRLSIARVGNQIVVTWKGQAQLQAAPDVSGPWNNVDQTSPATFDPRAGRRFYRTVQPGAVSGPVLAERP